MSDANMTTFLCHNWDKWQTYRQDRGAPPWIKVHRNLMTSHKWANLTDAEKGQLISIWVVAADKGGEIPSDVRILRKVCQLDELPNLNKFIELGFIESIERQRDDNMTPDRQPDDAPETETETETETEKKSVKKFTDDDLEMAQGMFTLIQALNPGHKPPNFETWADTIRLMRERDGRTHQEIACLFQWANADGFWKTNILSPAKLRDKWDQLTIQRGNPRHPAGRETFDQIVARTRREAGLPAIGGNS